MSTPFSPATNKALWISIFGLAFILAMFFPDHAMAATDGELSKEISKGFYCDFHGFFSSGHALFLGMLFGMIGLYKILKDKVIKGLIFIIVGALITAVPSLGESFLQGINKAMGGMATKSDLNFPSC